MCICSSIGDGVLFNLDGGDIARDGAPPKGFLPQKGFRCWGSAFTQIYIDSIYAAAGNKDIEIFIISECPFA